MEEEKKNVIPGEVGWGEIMVRGGRGGVPWLDRMRGRLCGQPFYRFDFSQDFLGLSLPGTCSDRKPKGKEKKKGDLIK